MQNKDFNELTHYLKKMHLIGQATQRMVNEGIEEGTPEFEALLDDIERQYAEYCEK